MKKTFQRATGGVTDPNLLVQFSDKRHIELYLVGNSISYSFIPKYLDGGKACLWVGRILACI